MCAFAFVAQAQVRKFHYVDGSYWVKVDIVLRKYHVYASQVPCLGFMNAMFTLHECHVYNIQMMMFWLTNMLCKE